MTKFGSISDTFRFNKKKCRRKKILIKKLFFSVHQKVNPTAVSCVNWQVINENTFVVFVRHKNLPYLSVINNNKK